MLQAVVQHAKHSLGILREEPLNVALLADDLVVDPTGLCGKPELLLGVSQLKTHAGKVW